MGALRGAQALGWAQVEARSLALLADRLAVAGRWSRDVVGDDALEGLGAPALVQLLRCMLTRCDGALYARPLVSQVELAPPRSGSFVLTVGGWAAAAAADGGAITSRWVALGRGLEWRVSVHPGGAGAGRGKHLSGEGGGCAVWRACLPGGLPALPCLRWSRWHSLFS